MASSRVGQSTSACTLLPEAIFFQNGQAERRRFAGSGLRLAHGILSRQQCRDSQNLNGGGSSNPKSSTAFKSSWDNPSSVNDAVMMFL